MSLVGDQVAFQQDTREVDLVRPGSSPRRLVRGPGPSDGLAGVFTSLKFGASPSLLAFTTSADSEYHGATCLYGCSATFADGPLGGSYSQLWSCGMSPVPPAFAVSAATVAYAIPSCVDTSSEQTPTFDRIVVHGTGSDGNSDLTIPLDSTSRVDLALAGDELAALSQQTRLQVWDATTGDPRFSARLHVYENYADGELHVQADGTAVFLVDHTPTCQEIAWASPTSPTEHVTAGCVSRGGIQLANGRVVFVAHGAINTSVIGGGPRRAVLQVGNVPVYGFDLETARLLTSLPACDGGAMIQIEDVNPGVSNIVDPVCPGTIPVQRARLSPGRLAIRVVCKSGCVGRVELATGTGAGLGGSSFTIPWSAKTKMVQVQLRRRVKLTGLRTIQAMLSIRRLDGRPTREAPTTLTLPRRA